MPLRWRSQRVQIRIRACARREVQQGRRVDAGKQTLQLRQTGQRFAQLREVARARSLQRDAREAALDISDMREHVVQVAVQSLVDQRSDRLQAQLDRLSIAQWPVQPAAQLASAHRRRSSIQDRGDGAIRAIGETGRELQVAARRRIELHCFAAVLGTQTAQVRQRGLLSIAHILQETACGCDRENTIGAAEAGQIARLELLTQRPGRGLQVEVPRRTLADESRHARRQRMLGNEQLGGAQALDLARQRFAALRFEHVEAAARQLQPGEAEALAVAEQRSEQRVAALFEECLVGDRARRHDAHHLALDRPFGLGRIADLLADRDRFAAPHELRQVALDAVERHARHRNRLASRLAARGQRDVEQARGALRIVIEQLVEIPHAVEQQHVRMLRLEAQVLLHHGSVGFERGGHVERL
jgi:hypothetical protein